MVLNKTIKSGNEITVNDYTMKNVSKSMAPADAIGSINGTAVAKIDLSSGTVLSNSMLTQKTEQLSKDLREQQYNMISLPTDLAAGDFIDIRLQLSDGGDYIVASKKNVQKADATTVWLNMNEEETLAMSNAIVEYYTMAGSKLYATKYTDPGTQEAAVATYSPNDTVKALKIDGEEATEQNIKDGKYKICRPFNIATKKGADNELAKDFISYIMSKEGQQVISDNGYIGDDSAEAYAGTKPSGKVVVGGSSSVSPVMEKLIEAYKKVNTGAEIELQTTDSTTGMTSAIDGSYDIGMASRELQDDEKDKLDSQAIATDGIAVIVNKNNTTDELSSDQVKDIYTGNAVAWDEVVK